VTARALLVRRARAVGIAAALVLAVFSVGLVAIQVGSHGHDTVLSVGQLREQLTIPTDRGGIYDRDGRVPVLPGLSTWTASAIGSTPIGQADGVTALQVPDHPTPVYGGAVVAPVFSSIMGWALRHYGVGTTAAPSVTVSPNPLGGRGTISVPAAVTTEGP